MIFLLITDYSLHFLRNKLKSSNKTSRKHWHSKTAQRAFLEEYAQVSHINSQEDWYAVTLAELISRGGKSVLDRYNSSISKMLTSLYPEYHIPQIKFHVLEIYLGFIKV